MYKIGVIGDKDSILGFKAVGMSVFPVTTPSEAQETLERIAEEQYAVIYITEHIAKDIVKTIEKYNERRFPAIIPIPGNQGSLGIGMSSIKKSVERAVGADILFRDN
ncbi:V-type ATP synthase subunit F [Acetivibrio clariflavus]|uniref:V-type ATP synthase subunit F n=1 Tax=Acetivibrio clariflavus (strain DSM 19732 / NBRC 101661 / EBR45) TaxID=720554 RepID=G8LZJ9_ACECE|nr:V-type ATP synthase subunit F [Acetivibrio clariflavus]AEV66862.1 archaeal/vacuolar-type H+-ATPase subunit F [Acetivibrio clariflavus DSM 19732]